MSEWSKQSVVEQWKQAAAERAQHLAPATEAMFALSDPRLLVEAAAAADLADVEVRVVAGERRVPSIGAARGS